MSDETKHTPAPWSIAQLNLEGLHSNDGSTSILAGDNGICSVASMSHFKRGEGNRHVCAERDANARLIAAAPDLIEAGKLMFGDNLINGVECVTISMASYEAMRAAISKAEGRAK